MFRSGFYIGRLSAHGSMPFKSLLDGYGTHSKLYTLNFIDDYSQKAWIYIIKKKSEGYELFKDWRVLVEIETGQRIKIFQTDK